MNDKILPANDPTKADAVPVRSVVRALALLNAVGAGLRTTGELQRAAAIPGPTAVRLLGALESQGFVSRGPGGYSPGPAVLKLFYTLEPHSLVWTLIRSAVSELLERTGETGLFMVESDGMRECLATAEPSHEIRRVVPIGGRFPLHTGASGKMFLAHGLLKKTLPKITDAEGNYITRSGEKRASDLLIADCEQAREQGVIDSIGVESWGVAAPILTNGTLLGVLSVSTPMFRYSDEKLVLYRETCKEVAARTTSLIADINTGFEAVTESVENDLPAS